MAPKDVKAAVDAMLILVGSHGQQLDGVIEFLKQVDKRLKALEATAPAPDSGDTK